MQICEFTARRGVIAVLTAVLGGGMAIRPMIARTLPQRTAPAPTAQPQMPAPAPAGQPPSPASPATPTAQLPTIVSNVQLVNLIANVQDKHGAFVSGLVQSNFRILEDGRPQQIRFFSSDTSVPITMGLLLDTSPSQINVLNDEQQVSDDFFQRILTPKDLAFVIGFDVDISLLQDLTSSNALLRKAINGTSIGGGDAAGSIVNPGPFPTQGQGGATKLWDAIYLACNEVLSRQAGRKALLVVTDGDDEGSTYKPQDALRAALDANTIVFAIVDADPRFYRMAGASYSGAGELEHLAEETGGRGFPAQHKDLQKTFDLVNDQLRTQYTMAYSSDRPQRDGTFRAIKIELAGPGTQDEKVRTRTGYYATATPSGSQ